MAITALHTASTGMQALSTKIDIIANNIANADTYGYKSSRANFQDLLYQIQAQPGVQTASSEVGTPLGTQIGLGVAVSNTQTIFSQGSAVATKNPLDAMIQGDGFFRVELPGGGIGYTRAGNFVRNANGELVLGNAFGYRLQDGLTIPSDVPDGAASFAADGSLVAIRNGVSEPVGRLTLARFPNPGGLINHGGNIYVATLASGEPIEAAAGENQMGTILPGTLEQSTTEAVTELVELIKAQRVFQMNSQSIQTADEALQVVANLRR